MCGARSIDEALSEYRRGLAVSSLDFSGYSPVLITRPSGLSVKIVIIDSVAPIRS